MTTVERLMAERDLLLSAISPEDYAKVQKQIVTISEAPGTTPALVNSGLPLTDYSIQLIHNGLMIPTPSAVKSMAREIRKWRGVPDPDLL